MSQVYQDFIRRHKLEYDASVEKAFKMSEEAHQGQFRHSGDAFFSHPLAVTDIIAELGLDNTTIIAGILHDSIEDTHLTVEDIKKEFNEEIVMLVDGVTKLSNYDFKSPEEQQSESLRKMFLAMATDIRVVIIKLADRLHNMRTLKYQSENKQIQKAKETLEIYAPLAHRLGINTIKWELEDLSLKFLHPDEYFEIANKIAYSRAEREKNLSFVIKKIEAKLTEVKIKAEIEGRPKHIYSIYRKMISKNKIFEEIYDLIAIRIIVSSVKDCYGVLGFVHTMYKPIPMRFKDYIAVPKQNMYQSLHTTLLGEDGRPFEVQIRTYDMHRTAEFGIAAHWKYKEGKKIGDIDSKLAWLRELMEWQNDLKDSKEFMETLKIDFLSENVFVFTPKGDVRDFVNGATPLDFAFSVHSDVGNKCVGAKINGKIVPLDYKLKTGDIIEILTSKNASPSRDWLKVAKTSLARNKIKLWFKKELKEENIEKGKELLEKEAKKHGYKLSDLLNKEWLALIFKRFSLNSKEDMYAAIGYNGISVHQILLKLIEQYNVANNVKDDTPKIKIVDKKAVGSSGDVSVSGSKGMLVKFAKCCNPVPFDKIIGYITRGSGVSVHNVDCKNIKGLEFEKDRLIDVEWELGQKSTYNVEIQVVANDRNSLIVDISKSLADSGKEITAINARTSKNGVANINIRSNITSIDELSGLTSKLRNIPGVMDVYRVNY